MLKIVHLQIKSNFDQYTYIYSGMIFYISLKDTFKTKHDYRKLEAKCKTIVQAKANKEILKKYSNLHSH